MNKHSVGQVLHELAAEAVPPYVDVWPAVEARLTRRRTFLARLAPTGRLRWVAVAFAAVLVFSAGARAAVPALSRLLQADERLTHVDLGRAQAVDLSQTIGDVTVTVQWVYADADYVLVGYTVRTADGRRFDPHRATLTSATLGPLSWQGGYGVTGHSDLVQVTLPPGEGTYAEIFTMPSSDAMRPQTLNVHFSVYADELVLATPAAPVSSTVEAGVEQVELQPLPAGAIVGPFEFDLVIPVSSAQ